MGNYEFVDLGELIENLDSIYAHTDDKSLRRLSKSI